MLPRCFRYLGGEIMVSSTTKSGEIPTDKLRMVHTILLDIANFNIDHSCSFWCVLEVGKLIGNAW